MNRSDIISAWAEIRVTNSSIPDDVLDFMKDSAISKLNEFEDERMIKYGVVKLPHEIIVEVKEEANG